MTCCIISSILLLASWLNSSFTFKKIIYKSTGDTLIGFTEEQAIPFILKTEDIDMGCVMSEAFTLFIQSFSQVTSPPNQLAIMFNLLAGNCAEFKAWEEELRYLRAMRAKKIEDAKDALIKQKRYLHLAARRQLAGYKNLKLAFIEPGSDCPDFNSKNGEFFWLVGLLDGLQAIFNDMLSGGHLGVPLDIGLKVGRGASCLDNEKWWGMPSAIQATIWSIFPDIKPEGKDPFMMLEQSMYMGKQQGMCISMVLAAQVYSGIGDIDKVKEIIRSHAMVIEKIPVNPKFRILNEMTTLQLRAISDRLWTTATGSRTPIGKLGSFWDDPEEAVDTIEIVDLI
ncbi:MAG: hypothetical protein GQ583_00745 [Methyloprofundus sp.]|nr:hypothetical protein [Methyloprofundus sp.]